jgi:vancomycin permeability regulator SanA
VREVLEWLSLVVPIVTIVTALLFWFGWTATDSRYEYLGIESSTLGLTTTDYVLRSADGIFVPATITLFIVLVSAAIHAVVSTAIREGWATLPLRVASIAAVLIGLASTVLGTVWMFNGAPANTYYLLRPILLGGGVLTLAYSIRVLVRVRSSSSPGRAGWERIGAWASAAIVLLMVFWAFSLYAHALGRGRAYTFANQLDKQPAAIVYSTHDLALAGHEEVTDSYFRYRYSGFRMVMKAGDKYVLLSEGWTRENGRAVLIDDTASVRIEFEPPRDPT